MEEDKNIFLSTKIYPRIKDNCFGCTTNKNIALCNFEEELNVLYNNSPNLFATDRSLEKNVEPPKKKS